MGEGEYGAWEREDRVDLLDAGGSGRAGQKTTPDSWGAASVLWGVPL